MLAAPHRSEKCATRLCRRCPDSYLPATIAEATDTGPLESICLSLRVIIQVGEPTSILTTAAPSPELSTALRLEASFESEPSLPSRVDSLRHPPSEEGTRHMLQSGPHRPRPGSNSPRLHSQLPTPVIGYIGAFSATWPKPGLGSRPCAYPDTLGTSPEPSGSRGTPSCVGTVRLQGVAPPTSPYCIILLPELMQPILPWALFPSKIPMPSSCATPWGGTPDPVPKHVPDSRCIPRSSEEAGPKPNPAIVASLFEVSVALRCVLHPRVSNVRFR